MSTMSQLDAVLTEQAVELGFETYEEAERAGYGIDYENAKLIEPQEAAHKVWEEEKKHLIEELKHAIEFIKGIKYE